MTTEIQAAKKAGPSEIDQGAVTFLVAQGIAREAAVELLREAGPPTGIENMPEWASRVLGRQGAAGERKRILAEHHEKGIPPPEPPVR